MRGWRLHLVAPVAHADAAANILDEEKIYAGERPRNAALDLNWPALRRFLDV